METPGVTVVSEAGIATFVPCVPEKTSDGYHTIEELYEHRHALFMALTCAMPWRSWKSRRHHDGPSYDGWFIALDLL